MKVVIADKKAQVRSALSLLLEQEDQYTICGETSKEDNLLDLVVTQGTDLLLLDWTLATVDSRTLISDLKMNLPTLLIVILGGTTDDMHLAIDAGADAFISKSEAPQYVLSILRLVTSGHTTDV